MYLKHTQILSLLAIGIMNYTAFSQKMSSFCSNDLYFGDVVENIKYHLYNPPLALNERYKSIKDVKNTTPEELFISMMSVQDNQWASYNYGKEKKYNSDHYKRIKTQDPKKNYVELIFKVSYSVDEKEYAFIKFNLYDENFNKPVSYCLNAFKKNNRWCFLDNKVDSNMDLILTVFTGSALDSIFGNKPHSNLLLSQIITEAWRNKTLDFAFIVTKYTELFSDNNKNIKGVIDQNNPYNFLK